MKAKDLRADIPVVVTSGPYEGMTVTVKNATVQPDGTPNQRKVLVTIPNIGPNGADVDEYMLPRMLEIPRDSFTMRSPSTPPAPAPAPLPAPVPAYSGSDADLTVIEHGVVQHAVDITDPMDESLDEFRPDANIVNEYVSRTLPGGLTDVEYMLALRDQRDSRGYSPNVALVGETQSGKTMLVRVLAVLAAQRDGLPKPYPVFTLNGSMGITDYEMFGQTAAVINNGREMLVWMDGLVPRALKCAAILYCDEWNAVPPQQAVALHPILDDRREFTNYRRAVPDGHGGYRPEVVPVNPNTWIISTINPGYKGTQTMAEASTNRFRWMPWDYDAEVETALIPSETVRLMGQALRTARAERALTVPIGTSALQRFNADCATFGVDNALWVFTGMFPPNERDRANTIIEDRGFLNILRAEYPNPTIAPRGADDTATTNRPTDREWNSPF